MQSRLYCVMTTMTNHVYSSCWHLNDPRQGLKPVLNYCSEGNQLQTDNTVNSCLQVRQAAMEAIAKVCRTASTLYELMAYYKVLHLNGKSADKSGMGNWSHSLRKTISDWYLNRKPIDVAMQVNFCSVSSLPCLDFLDLCCAPVSISHCHGHLLLSGC